MTSVRCSFETRYTGGLSRDPAACVQLHLILQVAGRTNDSAGDGTTTASILARDMIKYGMQAVSAGMNPVPIKKGIDKTVAFLEGELAKRAIPVASSADIQAVATISAGNDKFVGDLIANALDKVGKDGVLSIETSSGLETTVDVTEGMEIDRGYISPQFITNQEKMLVEFENCRVLITDHKIENIKTLVPILEQVRSLDGAPGCIQALLEFLCCMHTGLAPLLCSLHSTLLTSCSC